MDGPWPLRICGMRCGVPPCCCPAAAIWSPGATARQTPPAGGWSQSGTRESCSCWSSSLPGHSQAAGRDRLHRVRTAPSPLQDLFGETLVVNSAHHQAADRLGQGLRAVQWAIDGTVEAVIHQSLPVWGVQWHPERLAGPLSLSGAADGGCLFTAWLALAGGTGQS